MRAKQTSNVLCTHTGCPNKFGIDSFNVKNLKSAKLEFEIFFVKIRQTEVRSALLCWNLERKQTFTIFFAFCDFLRFFAKSLSKTCWALCM